MVHKKVERTCLTLIQQSGENENKKCM